MSDATAASAAAATDKQFFGHPRGLSTLFFTELWERFSYYGLRGLLVLFLTAAIADGGMGMTDARAGAILGLYTAGVYLAALPGGWFADRLIGQRNAVFYGGIIIAAGHFSMATGSDALFFFGLFLIVVGTGLLKPNVSAIVGDLYGEDEAARRDAGFTLFYMGINLGAFFGPTGVRLSRGEHRLALRLRSRGRGHGLRAHPVQDGRELLRRGGSAAGRCRRDALASQPRAHRGDRGGGRGGGGCLAPLRAWAPCRWPRRTWHRSPGS